jgi:hypothetical protein
MSDPFAEAALLMADSRYAVGREFSAPLSGNTTGRLELPRGSAYLTIRGDADPGMLFQARFGSPMAEVVEERGTVRVIYHQHGGRLRREKYEGLVLLNAGVLWAITCSGGAAWLRADLRRVAVTAMSISHGVSDVEIDLAPPTGVVPISIRGGVSEVTIRRPQGVAARLRVTGGASNVTFDQQALGAVGGKLVLATPDVDTADARYEIEITGGISGVRVISDPSAQAADAPPSPAT